MRRRLILHVGLPKTATTALQHWMRDRRSALLARGIDYPDLFPPDQSKHGFIVAELLRHPILPRLEEVLVASSAPALLLSNEGLTNHLDDFTPEALTRFRALTADREVTVGLVTREPQAWVRSYHRQNVLNPKNGASPLNGTALTLEAFAAHPKVRTLTDHSLLRERLRAAFGAAKMVEATYGGEGWDTQFRAALGMGPLASEPLPQENESLPDWVFALLLRLNAAIPEETERQPWKAMLGAYLGSDSLWLSRARIESGRHGRPGPDIRLLPQLRGAPNETGTRDSDAFLDWVAARVDA